MRQLLLLVLGTTALACAGSGSSPSGDDSSATQGPFCPPPVPHPVFADAGAADTSTSASDATGGMDSSRGTMDASPGAAGYLHTSGGQILDAAGNPVRLTGVNWFGAETGTFCPHGLWARGMGSLLDQIASLGFISVSVPYRKQG